MLLSDHPAATLAPAEADALKRRQLRRMQWTATGLFFVVALIYGLATYLDGRGAAWSYVAAFAEAAMVGAIADWFAVTALFRHPLGLRFIPHTAIIPRNKARIANNLGAFVQGEFFAHERIGATIQAIDPAARLSAWLSRPQNAALVANAARDSLAVAVDALDDAAVRRFVDRNVTNLVSELDLSELAGRVLQALTHEGRHQAVFDQMLKSINHFISEPAIQEVLVDRLADKVPLYFDRVKSSTARYVLERALDSLRELLASVEADPDHRLRKTFDTSVQGLAERLRTDPELRASIRTYQQDIASNPALRDYVHQLWEDFKVWVKQDLNAPDSRVQAKVADVVMHAGRTLAADVAMQAWVNRTILGYVPALLDRLRPKIGALISDKVNEWKDEEVVDKLELNIGKDLQFIRINGTVVGGLVGLIIHTVTVWLH